MRTISGRSADTFTSTRYGGKGLWPRTRLTGPGQIIPAMLLAGPRRKGSGTIHVAWQCEMGGQPEAAYRRFVTEGLAIVAGDPIRVAVGGWLLGSATFVMRLRAGMTLPRHGDAIPAARRLACYDYRVVLGAVAEHSGIAADRFLRQRSGAAPGSCRLAGAGVDAGDAPGSIRGFRADRSAQRPQPNSPGQSRPAWLPSALRRDRGHPPTAPENRKPALTPQSPRAPECLARHGNFCRIETYDWQLSHISVHCVSHGFGAALSAMA